MPTVYRLMPSIFIRISSATFLMLLIVSAATPSFAKYSNDNRYSGIKATIVSGFAQNVGVKDNNRVIVNTVPPGKRFILTDVVADRFLRSFSFSISEKISLSININEYKVDQSPSWHFKSGIPFKAGEDIVIKNIDGAGNVFISGYLVDDK